MSTGADFSGSSASVGEPEDSEGRLATIRTARGLACEPLREGRFVKVILELMCKPNGAGVGGGDIEISSGSGER